MTPPTTTPRPHPARPADRYGAPRPWTRPLAVGLAVLLAVGGGGWLVWAALYHADTDVAARVQSFQVLSSSQVEVVVAIERDSGTAVACVVQAQAVDHSVVGERRVTVAAGARTSLVRSYVVTTEREATTAVVDTCTTETG